MKERIKLFSDKEIQNHARQGDTIFIDMDDTIVDHSITYSKVSSGEINESNASVSFILRYSIPYENCVDVIKKLYKKYDLYILTGSSWNKPSDKFNGMDWKYDWLRKYFGPDSLNIFYNKVIFCTHKELLIPSGAYLIDNKLNIKSGTIEWDRRNKLIHFGNSQFPDWKAISKFLL